MTCVDEPFLGLQIPLEGQEIRLFQFFSVISFSETQRRQGRKCQPTTSACATFFCAVAAGAAAVAYLLSFLYIIIIFHFFSQSVAISRNRRRCVVCVFGPQINSE